MKTRVQPGKKSSIPTPAQLRQAETHASALDQYCTVLQASRYRACPASPSGDDPATSITPIPAAVDEIAGSTAGASDERYLPPDAVDGWFRLAACVAAGEKDPQRRREWEEWGYELART